MHEPKKEYDPKKEKREDKPVCKTITCVNCGKIIAEGSIRHGKIEIICPNCKVRNSVEATPRDVVVEIKSIVSGNDLYDVWQRNRTANMNARNHCIT